MTFAFGLIVGVVVGWVALEVFDVVEEALER